MAYKSVKYVRGTARGIYTSKRRRDKVVALKHNLPGSIILVHGVNDVGTGYAAAEAGLCAGLTARLAGDLRPAGYSNPSEKEVMEDPDAALYKRQPTKDTHSPVIPFYWGYREEKKFVQPGTSTPHGQALDRYGNRLDKDFSKGGGPFANATSSLPEMWNRGKSDAGGSLDYFQADATHPVLDCPGRLYMILAARRLAALITMIRDFHKDETVSIVAHSQGCMLSLLAQAFLLDEKMREQQPNARPADTLILCNPPYSLVDEVPNTVRIVDGYAGSDAAMKDQYALLDGSKTLNSRLTTLVNTEDRQALRCCRRKMGSAERSRQSRQGIPVLFSRRHDGRLVQCAGHRLARGSRLCTRLAVRENPLQEGLWQGPIYKRSRSNGADRVYA
jgi:pimeloyl-ACP methyl ester carboxylesterase